MNLGTKIKLRCDELDISPRQAAIRSGLSVSFVSEVIRGIKGLSTESAKKLALALDWPENELLETIPTRPERWFWTARIGSLTPADLESLQSGQPIERAAWTIRQVQEHFPSLDLATLMQTTPDHVQRMADGVGHLAGEVMDAMGNALNLPRYWLALGEQGPSEELLQRVLVHRQAKDWLELVADAIRDDIPPHIVQRLLTTVREITDAK